MKKAGSASVKYEWTDDDGVKRTAFVARDADGRYHLRNGGQFIRATHEEARLLLKAFLDIGTEFLPRG